MDHSEEPGFFEIFGPLNGGPKNGDWPCPKRVPITLSEDDWGSKITSKTQSIYMFRFHK